MMPCHQSSQGQGHPGSTIPAVLGTVKSMHEQHGAYEFNGACNRSQLLAANAGI
jgi:hypothetical protein